MRRSPTCRTCQPDVLKIDRTFVSGEFERDGAPLLSTILNIGSTLGLMTVGEGIENQDQLAMLRNGGCDIGQVATTRPGRCPPLRCARCSSSAGQPIVVPQHRVARVARGERGIGTTGGDRPSDDCLLPVAGEVDRVQREIEAGSVGFRRLRRVRLREPDPAPGSTASTAAPTSWPRRRAS